MRSNVTSGCLCLSWFLSFLFVKIFPAVIEVMGLHGAIFIFAASCFVGAFYTFFYIPETKGKSLAEIEKLFKKWM